MLPEEIDSVTKAVVKARAKKGLGVHKHYETTAEPLDWSLCYRSPKDLDENDLKLDSDAGPVIFPKLFRRLAKWSVNKRSRMVACDLKAYLSRHPDECFLVSDFLKLGPTKAPKRSLVDLINSKGRLTKRPEEIVFREADSRLVGEMKDW